MLFGEYARLLESQRREAMSRIADHVMDNVPHEFQGVTLQRLQEDVGRTFECLSDNLMLLEESVHATRSSRCAMQPCD